MTSPNLLKIFPFIFLLYYYNGTLFGNFFFFFNKHSEEGKQRDDDCHRWNARPVGTKRKKQGSTCYALTIVLEKRPRTSPLRGSNHEWKPVNCTDNRNSEQVAIVYTTHTISIRSLSLSLSTQTKNSFAHYSEGRGFFKLEKKKN